jgi:hypothetical protein
MKRCAGAALLLAFFSVSPLARGESLPAADAEAVCSLRSAYTAERSYFSEYDRFGSLSEAGFLPLPCADGTRVGTSGEEVAGCHFRYRIRHGGAPAALRIEALDARGRPRFAVDARRRFTRRGVEVPLPDCDAWRARADPLAHYHEVVARDDCEVPPASPNHPCYAALRELIALAHQGVGAAQKALAHHPFARELDPTWKPNTVQRLCAWMPGARGRAEAAEELFRKGGLLALVKSPSCSKEGRQIAAETLLTHLESFCPGATCLEALHQLAKVHSPAYHVALADHAAVVARELLKLGESELQKELVAVLDFPPATAKAFLALRHGQPAALERLKDLPDDPVTALLCQEVSARSEQAEARLHLAAGLRGAKIDPIALSTWLASASCYELQTVRMPVPGRDQLPLWIATVPRCPKAVALRLQTVLPTVPAGEIPALLAPLDDTQVRALDDVLGLDDPARTQALLAWVVERIPRQLQWAALNEESVRWLLRPETVCRLGGRDPLLQTLAYNWSLSLSSPSPATRRLVFSNALAAPISTDTLRRLIGISREWPEQLELLAPVRQGTSSSLKAATGMALAIAGSRTIPVELADACAAELAQYARCTGKIDATLGPRPLGQLQLCGFFNCENPVSLQGYCDERKRRVSQCNPVCGDELPRWSVLWDLGNAASKPIVLHAADRACDPTLEIRGPRPGVVIAP